jgi:nucleoside-diphosphate-sugar epimerase
MPETTGNIGGINVTPGPGGINARIPVGQTGERYFPSAQRAQSELGFKETIGLRDSVRRTLAWHHQKSARQPASATRLTTEVEQSSQAAFVTVCVHR